jgi:hypothetical protein
MNGPQMPLDTGGGEWMGFFAICWLSVYFDRLHGFSGSPASPMPVANKLTWYIADRLWVTAIPVEDESICIDSYCSSTSEILDDSIVAAIVRMAKKATRAAKNKRKYAIMLILL